MVGEKGKLLVGVLTLHLCYAGFHIISRVALDMGIGKVVFLVYRNMMAVILLAPFAYFLEKNIRPPMSFLLAAKFFVLASIVSLSQGFYILGLFYLSPTFASVILNAIPAVTFAMAAAVRLEKLNITKIHGVAKLVGTLLSISGATIVTLYKGIPLLQDIQPSTDYTIPFLESPSSSSFPVLTSVIRNWELGCLCLVGHCITWSSWMVVQVPLLNNYPARISASAITSFFGIIQCLVVAAFVDRGAEKWTIHSSRELLSTLYAGIVGSGIAFTIQMWCIARGGPLYVAVFQPLQTVAVALMATCILGDQLYSGGMIGAVVIIIGLYFVIWGKSKEAVCATVEQEGAHLINPLLDCGSKKQPLA